MVTMPDRGLLRAGESVLIPPGAAGGEALARLTVAVPPRTQGRTAAHREQFCAAALLRALWAECPGFFPATLTKGEAPDFLLWSHALSRGLALEHTDVGSAGLAEARARGAAGGRRRRPLLGGRLRGRRARTAVAGRPHGGGATQGGAAQLAE